MVLSNREKTAIIVSHLISSYSENLHQGNVQENQSVVDFIIKKIPDSYKIELDIDLIDDIFSFVSNQHMELS